MALLSKKTEAERHAGSGLDQPDPKSLLDKVAAAFRPALPAKPVSPKEPSPPIEEVVSTPVATAGSD